MEALTRQIEKLEREIVAEAKRDEDMRRLTAIRASERSRRLPSKRWFRIPTDSNPAVTSPPGWG